MSLSLRPYQLRAIERVFELFFVMGVKRVLLVLPTGGGKTVIASEIVRRFVEMQMSAVFLAHRREIVRQTFVKLVRNGLPPQQVSIVMAGESWKTVDAIAPPPDELDDDELLRLWARRRLNVPIYLGSIDTFRNVTKPAVDLVIVDEAHRALAPSYRAVQTSYPDAFHLGLTATPFRADGKGLDDAYDAIVVVATFMELVEEGFLVEPICFGSRSKVDLTGVRRSKGDYNQDDLARAADKSELVGDIVQHWLRRGNDAPTFCFAVSVAHSKHLAERFNAAGVPALHVDGDTETDERDRAIKALRAGDVKVLCNCNVFTEGTDVPQVKTIILARPTLSEGLYLQQAGRGARPHGDTPFVILDHARCCSDPNLGGLPQATREYTLEGRRRRGREGERLAPTKMCEGCLAIVPIATRECPGCGKAFPAPAAAEDGPGPKETDEELVQLNQLTPAQQKRLDRWDAFVADWREENERRDREGLPLLQGGTSLSGEWRKREHAWPPKGAKVPSLTLEQRARSQQRVDAKKRAKRPQPALAGLEEYFS